MYEGERRGGELKRDLTPVQILGPRTIRNNLNTVTEFKRAKNPETMRIALNWDQDSHCKYATILAGAEFGINPLSFP